jgi:Tfp pilus assembly protein FimT
MRNIQGLTLIELVVTLSVVFVLIGALGFSFQGWKESYALESQVKETYSDLMNTRIRSMQMNRVHFVVMNANDYQIFEDSNENEQFDAALDKKALLAHAKKFTSASFWSGMVRIDHRGLVSCSPGPNATIRFNTDGKNPDYDCIVLCATRINTGKWDGESCNTQ